MNAYLSRTDEASGLSTCAWLLMAMWTLAVIISLWWNLAQKQQQVLKIAFTEAKASYDKDLFYRRWAAEQGGIYVPSHNTAPVAGRESSGAALTRVSPAHMLRQVDVLARKAGNLQERVISLKPVNPDNLPDAWEKKALEAFKQGKTEYSGIEIRAGKHYLRVMYPVMTEKSCLGCHEEKGSRVGELRGGVSVTVPLSPLWQVAKPATMSLWWGHGLVWLLGLGGIILGFSQLRAKHDRMVTLMFTDPLTGIPNRRIFLDSLEVGISYAQRHKTPLAVIMADLDNFKSVNDTFGHDTGDRVLQAFAILLVEKSRQEDLVARFGGEEFILMLPGTSAQEAALLGERIKSSWEATALAEFKVKLTSSFGISGYQRGDSVSTLIDRADQALYEAKRLGKNQVVLVEEDKAEDLEAQTQKVEHFLKVLAR